MNKRLDRNEQKFQNLSGFTQQQKSAIQCDLSPTLVIAGAGSGKTLVLAKRFEYLVLEKNIDPKRILVVTFSKKAAANMKKRIFKYINLKSDVQKQCHISTFHKFSGIFLKEEFCLDLNKNSLGYEKKDKSIFRDVIKDLEAPISATTIAWAISKQLRWISKRDQRKFNVDDFLAVGLKCTHFNEKELLEKFPFEKLKEVYDEYDIRLKNQGILTFDDLILDTNNHLNNKELRKKWQGRFDAILCDEFQDIDDVQFEILKKICPNNNNLFCVGDPDQSIYGFRGAVPHIFNRFQEHFGNKKIDTNIKKLEQNFRSVPKILEVANTLISFNKGDRFDKLLYTDVENGDKDTVSMYVTDSPEIEEEQIIERILFLNTELGIPFKEIAVLARNSHYSKSIINRLIEKRIPYFNRVDEIGNPSESQNQIAYDMKKEEIRDLFCWLDIAISDDPEILGNAMKRVINKPSRGIGLKTIKELFKSGPIMGLYSIKISNNAKVAKFYNLHLALKEIAADKTRNMGVRQKVDAILKVSGFWKKYSKTPEKFNTVNAFLKGVINEDTTMETIKTEMMRWTPRSLDGDEIIVGTIHSVKGLEFEHVFLMRLGEGQLPSSIGLYKLKTDTEKMEYIEEERRLAYVAVTRAKSSLYLSSSTGEENVSRFALEVRHLLDSWTINEIGEVRTNESYDWIYEYE